MSDTNVLTLIAPQAHQGYLGGVAEQIAHILSGSGADIRDHRWLGENACDIYFAAMSCRDAESLVAMRVRPVEKTPFDMIAQGVEGRRKKLLICDMDSTMIQQECIDELADCLGLKEKIAAITDRAMNGELDFVQALDERVALLAGLEEGAMEKVYNERITFTPGARALVQTMREGGAHCVLVSGGFTFFTARVREALGFHADHSNLLGIENGRLTGKVHPPVLDKDAKKATLERYTAELGIAGQATLAVGDGANDLPMLLAAGLGVAYHAKPHVRAKAHHRIECTDLFSLLYAQGYKQEEFRE